MLNNPLSTDTICHAARSQTLLAYGWLAEIDPAFAEAVIAAGVWKKVARDVRLFKAGDFANDIFGLAEGVVAITSVVDFEEDALFHLSRPPAWLGWPTLLGERRRAYTATMKTPGWALKVPGRAIATLLDHHPRGWAALMPLAARYNELGAAAADDLLIRKSAQRVIAVLLRLSGHGGFANGPALNALPDTKHELAGAANLSRNTIISILHALEARNVVTLGKGYVVVHRAAALAELVSEPAGESLDKPALRLPAVAPHAA